MTKKKKKIGLKLLYQLQCYTKASNSEHFLFCDYIKVAFGGTDLKEESECETFLKWLQILIQGRITLSQCVLLRREISKSVSFTSAQILLSKFDGG